MLRNIKNHFGRWSHWPQTEKNFWVESLIFQAWPQVCFCFFLRPNDVLSEIVITTLVRKHNVIVREPQVTVSAGLNEICP